MKETIIGELLGVGLTLVLGTVLLTDATFSDIVRLILLWYLPYRATSWIQAKAR